MSAAPYADASPELRAALADIRPNRYGNLVPLDGLLWFTDRHICAVCGSQSGNASALDHCHVTGWERGWLCAGCNLTEGRTSDDPTEGDDATIFHAWRRTAPLLHLRRPSRWERRSWLTDADLASDLTIDELFALDAERRRVATMSADAFAANALASVIGAAA